MYEGRPGLVKKKVTVHRGDKTFEQYRWVREGTEPTKEEKPKKEEPGKERIPKEAGGKNERPDLNVMVDGKLPTFGSLPKNIKIPDAEIKKMDKIVKKSGKIEKEIAAPINIVKGKMSIGNPNVGSENNCLIPAGTDNYAVYHTHPDAMGIKVLDSFSLEDIMLVTTRHRLQRSNIMMAHTVRNGNLWVCVPSSETMGEIDNGMTDIAGTQKFVSSIASDMDTAIMEKNGKRGRRAIKKYCDKFKMKLYVGQPGDLKEYDGKW